MRESKFFTIHEAFVCFCCLYFAHTQISFLKPKSFPSPTLEMGFFHRLSQNPFDVLRRIVVKKKVLAQSKISWINNKLKAYGFQILKKSLRDRLMRKCLSHGIKTVWLHKLSKNSQLSSSFDVNIKELKNFKSTSLKALQSRPVRTP